MLIPSTRAPLAAALAFAVGSQPAAGNSQAVCGNLDGRAPGTGRSRRMPRPAAR